MEIAIKQQNDVIYNLNEEIKFIKAKLLSPECCGSSNGPLNKGN